MIIGTATVDITPEIGCDLSGYVARIQPSLGIHTPLHAHVLYLEHEGRRHLWLHAEVIAFEHSWVQSLKRELSERTGLPMEALTLSATHTHAGPCTIRLVNCGEYDAAYMDRLRHLLLDAAPKALESCEHVEMCFAEGRNDLAIDRRGKPTAHTDPRLPVIGWKRKDGTYAAVLANMALHNVALGGDNRHISGDLFGCAASAIKEFLPGHPVVLFTNGACGNLNPPKHAEDFTQLELWADDLAHTVVDALATAPTCDPALSSDYELLQIPLDEVDLDSIDRWADALVESVAHMEGYVADRIRQAATAWKDGMRARLERCPAPGHVPMELQAIQLGPVRLICMGAEAFSLMADQLRENLGQHTYVVGYANGDIGYLPAPEAYDEGGYEVEEAFVFYNSLRPSPGAFAMVREHAVAFGRPSLHP